MARSFWDCHNGLRIMRPLARLGLIVGEISWKHGKCWMVEVIKSTNPSNVGLPTGHALDPPHLPCIKRSSEVSWHGFCPDLLLNLWGILQMSSRQTPQGACPKVRVLSSCGWAGGKVAPNTARRAKGLTTSYHGISVLCVLVTWLYSYAYIYLCR